MGDCIGDGLLSGKLGVWTMVHVVLGSTALTFWSSGSGSRVQGSGFTTITSGLAVP